MTNVRALGVDALATSLVERYEWSMNATESTNVKAVVDAVSNTEVASDPRSIGDALRAMIAGGRAAHVLSSSLSLFEAGGRALVSESTQACIRTLAERGAERALGVATRPLLGATMLPPGTLGTAVEAARSAAPLAARAAAKELLKGAGKAGGLGLVIDGAVASLEAAVAVRSGAMDRRTAAIHVAAEAATGAASTAAGVLLGAGLVALTGGIGAPVVFALGAIGAIGAKQLLRRYTTATTASARERDDGDGAPDALGPHERHDDLASSSPR